MVFEHSNMQHTLEPCASFPAPDSIPYMAEHCDLMLAFYLACPFAMQADSIPSVSEDGATVRVMAGQHNTTVGPIKMRNPGLLMDVTVEKGSKFVQEVGFWGLVATKGGLLHKIDGIMWSD